MARPVIHLIPHTHWDREWYLPLGGFRARLVAMVDALAGQLERDPRIPGFLLDGQTALLEDYLALRPEQRGRIARLVREGRIDTGPWRILADEQIPSGESLLRNLALGAEAAEALGGRLPVLYSPDAFGHPAILPSLGAQYGLRFAVVWRGLGSEATADRDLAWWRGPDGSRVLVYHLPPDGYEIGSNLLVDDAHLGAAWERVSAAVLPRAATRQVAVFVGADHHAAPADLGELAARLQRVDRTAEFRLSRLATFFEAAEREADGLAELDGEFRWSYGYTWTLQGTIATRAPLKRRNAALELLLTREAEPLAALAGDPEGTARAVLRQAWSEVVDSHFHDAICGCASDLVARAVEVRFDDAQAGASEVKRSAVARLMGQDQDLMRDGVSQGARLALWNGAVRARGGVVIAEGSFFVRDVLVGPPGSRAPRKGRGFAPFALREISSGLTVAPQLLSLTPGLERRDAPRHYPDQDEVERVRFALPLPRSLPGMTLRLFEPVQDPAEPMEEFVAAGPRRVWNARMVATVERTGTVELEEPVSGMRYGGLLRLESEPDQGDSYSFCPVRGATVSVPRGATRPEVVAAGPLVAALRWGSSLPVSGGRDRLKGRVACETTMELVGDQGALRVRLELENQGCDHRLRLRVPTGLRRGRCRAGAAFGWVERGVVKPVRSPRESVVPTAPAHRWVAAARKECGLALFAPGCFEYEWTAGGDLVVTLLRSVGELSKSGLATRPGHAGWPTPTPLAQCLGRDVVELGIAPISEADLQAPERLEQLWEELFVPPLAVWERDATGLPLPPVPAVELTGDGLVFSSCVAGETPGTLVLRCFNTREVAVAGAWLFGAPVRRAMRTRADGTELGTLAVSSEDGARVAFEAGPREIVTVSVQLGLLSG